MIYVLELPFVAFGAISTTPIRCVADTWSACGTFGPPDFQSHRLEMGTAVV